MFRLARVWRLKTVQHGLVFITSGQCGVKSIDYSLRITKEVLLRNEPDGPVAGFNRVKLRTGSERSDKRSLSQVLLDVALVDEMPLPLRDLIPPFLKCVETVLRGDELEAKDVTSVAVANLKSGLIQLVNPEGQFGLSDDALRALDSASKMLETDANVKIVSELLLPLMKGFCVFNTNHRKALQKISADNSRLCLPPSLNWKGLALGNSKLWFGELDVLLCPELDSFQEYGQFPVAVVQQDKDYVPEFSPATKGKRRLNEEWSLLGEGTYFSQAYATAIVFSFLCHYKFGMKRSFIPTLWISPQAFAVFFYDCKKDIMISKYCLWTEYTLVFLWTVLHYPIFYPPSWLHLGIESVPFGYLDNLHNDFRFLDENEFYFGESLRSPVFRQTHPFLGRATCDWRTKPDKGVFFTKPKDK